MLPNRFERRAPGLRAPPRRPRRRPSGAGPPGCGGAAFALRALHGLVLLSDNHRTNPELIDCSEPASFTETIFL